MRRSCSMVLGMIIMEQHTVIRHTAVAYSIPSYTILYTHSKTKPLLLHLYSNYSIDSNKDRHY